MPAPVTPHLSLIIVTTQESYLKKTLTPAQDIALLIN